MAYDFHSRLRHANTRFKGMGIDVRYVRTFRADEDDGPGTLSVNVKAFRIRREAEEIIPGIAVTRLEFQEWGIDRADITAAFGSADQVPRSGDVIEVVGTGEQFRAVSMSGYSPVYKYVTADRRRVLINTERT